MISSSSEETTWFCSQDDYVNYTARPPCIIDIIALCLAFIISNVVLSLAQRKTCSHAVANKIAGMAQLDFPEFGEMSHNHCQPHCTAQLHSPAHLSHSRFTGIPGRTRSFSSFRQTQLVVHCADENINTECIDPSGCLLDILTGQCDRHVGKSRLGKRIR